MRASHIISFIEKQIEIIEKKKISLNNEVEIIITIIINAGKTNNFFKGYDYCR